MAHDQTSHSAGSHAWARRLAKLAGAGIVAGGALVGYGMYEAKSYRLNSEVVPVLPEGSDPLVVLHLSDLHMTPKQNDKVQWVRSLAAFEPDLVIATGDFLSSAQGVPYVLQALEPLLSVPGVFVLGSNDYFSPRFGNPLSYLSRPSTGTKEREVDLPWEELKAGLSSQGWIDLSNRRDRLTVGGIAIDARGVDDPHIGRDDYPQVAGPFDQDADLRLGVTHAPYLRVIDAMASDDADLIIAGHTHGGQVCVPGYGALTTNCDLDVKRAKGLHDHLGSALHVSAGIGTNPYTPIRIACPPEATQLILTERM